MSKGLLIIVATIFMNQTASAEGYLLSDDQMKMESNDVVVPVVDSVSDIKIQAGLMFYDIGAGLKIVNNLGQVEAATYPNGVESDSGGEKVNRVRVGSTCTSSPCSISSQSGSWVSSIVRGSTGDYTVNFNSGTFSSAPSCVAISETGSAAGTFIPSPATTSSVGVRFFAPNTLGSADAAFNIICMGPQ